MAQAVRPVSFWSQILVPSMRGLYFCLALCLTVSNASIHSVSQYSLAAASLPHYAPLSHRRRRRLSRRLMYHADHGSLSQSSSSPEEFDTKNPFYYASQQTRAVPASKTIKKAGEQTSKANASAVASSKAQPTISRAYSYADLTPLGRLIAGTVEVAVVTAIDYIQGLFGGYVLGTLTDIPRLLFRPLQPDVQRPLWNEFSGRCLRMHQKSTRWGKSWAGISATYGGLCVAARVLRGGTEDDWNVVLGTMAAGAMFARKDGPQAMIRGAIIYGGLTYILSKGSSNRQPFEYKDQPVEL